MTSSFNVHKASGYEKLMGAGAANLLLTSLDFVN
jgi:hypothetical protein